MGSILQDLYYGRLFPEERFTPRFADYQTMREEHSSHYTGFVDRLKTFDAALEKQFLDILDEQAEAIPFENAEMFIYGFRMGAKMMMEILTDLPDDPA